MLRSVMYSSPRSGWRARWAVGAVAGLLMLAACAEPIVAPLVPIEAVVTNPVESLAVRDVLERVVPSLPAGPQTAALTHALAQLTDRLDAGRLSEATVSLARARGLLRATQAADDGAMAADLIVMELALEDAGALLDAAMAAPPSRRQ